MKPLISLSLLSIAVAAISPAAAAGPTSNEGRAISNVSYNDLDLSKAGDLARLKRRINLAAGRVCEEIDWNSPAQLTLVNKNCYRTAIKDAVAQLDRAVARADTSATLAVVARK
jgi:UrcA family protein